MADALNDPAAAPLPDPLREQPPADRWCDLVLAGGVASGIVYPWAILELARAYRLRNIGGTSVGAMAAAIAAACEYGRRNGHSQAYEVLRRLPRELAEPVESAARGAPRRPRMLSLFQPAPQGRRLFAVLLAVLDAAYGNDRPASPDAPPAGRRPGSGLWRALRAGVVAVAVAYGPWRLWVRAGLVALGGVALWMPVRLHAGHAELASWILHVGLALALIIAVVALVLAARQLWRDVREGLIDNDFGLCRGSSQEKDADGRPRPALVDWLHDGIQRAAGLPLDGPPLTFEDLWHAPLQPGGPRPGRATDREPRERGEPDAPSINLEMVTTNVTHRRPYRLPLRDREARLFYRPEDWHEFFPKAVMDALQAASSPYAPTSISDPPAPPGAEGLLELPCGRLPVVVAARLSLSYPLLFSAVPLYAIDYEEPVRAKRQLRRCRFSDGGLCANFPIHLFDSALPRWPTFGLWLQARSRFRPDESVWLPRFDGDGRGDSWSRFEPGPAASPDASDPVDLAGLPPGAAAALPSGQRGRRGQRAGADRPTAGNLFGFLGAALLAAKDWRDHTALRMPHVRHRVARIALLSGEGELNIGMRSETLLHMASDYGTRAGRLLRETYAPPPGAAEPTPAWREHLRVRAEVLLGGLRDLLRNIDLAAAGVGHTQSLDDLLAALQAPPPALTAEQAQELRALVDQLIRLEASLATRAPPPRRPRPQPELRLRPPL